MLSLLTIFAMHVPQDNRLSCEDYQWLKQGLEESTLFTPSERFDIILRWMNYTDPHCFDNKDAKAD